MKQRRGVVYVIEAVIAAVLLFFFLIVVMPSGETDTTQPDTVNTYLYNTLTALDAADQLREPVIQGDVDALEDRVDDHVTGVQTEVALLTANMTTADVRFSDTYTTSFTVSDAVERQQLRIWYRNAADPTVQVNGTTVSTETGVIQNETQVYDISEYTDTGQNTLNLSVTDTSRVGYSIELYEQQQSGEPPSNSNVFTTSYLVSGDTVLQPAEVTVIAWQ